MSKENKLYERVLNNIEERRNRLINGYENCIPWGLPRFEDVLPGIEQGKYYLISANSKVGKTQITDSLFLINILEQIIDNGLNIKAKIFYFSLEMTKEEKMLSLMSNILYKKEGVRLSPTELQSTNRNKPISDDVLTLIRKYEEYFNKVEEIVEFIDDVRNGYGMFNLVRGYMEENGKMHYKELRIDGKVHKVRDYYEPNDPDLYVFAIIDHIGLISTETRDGKKLNLYESISLLSSDYLIRLRNVYNIIPVVVQQQASSQESIENKKANKLKPSLDGLGDNKTTQRDANVILGLFSPFRHELREYYGYDITKFRDQIRFLEILGGREGGAGTIAPLYFDGAVNFFTELPDPKDSVNINKVYNLINKINGINT